MSWEMRTERRVCKHCGTITDEDAPCSNCGK